VPTNTGIALITEIHRAVHALGLQLAHSDITQAEGLVLALLEPVGSAPLEEVLKAFLHRRSTLTSVLDRLTGRGWVERLTDPADNRRYHVRLTPSGRKKAAQIAGVFAGVIARSRIAEKDLAAARRTLSRIVEAASA
jgi:DNA-binding MarR family transcriptional regulator